ncbi:MAG TPA: potassium channel protein [Gammaproteobacteria bacterium]|nr:potassium channel protein [Gammaproteobacteria bacterium]
MQPVFYLLLQRMRLPLIVLIVVYAVSIVGMTLIPGVDDQGKPWRMDFFHAIYFVSFLGTTIGFGEIPYPFTDAQRLWTTGVIYAAVVAWLYAIGTILAIIQDQGFRRVLTFSSFSRHVRRMQDPFYIICGYGDAGSLLVRELTERHIQCVVVEKDPERILGLKVADLLEDVHGLCDDAADSGVLIAAGLRHRCCRGIIGLTGNDHDNLTIAITSKLLAPQLPVICQSDTGDTAANMDSFGTDYIIDPFDIFASRFALLFHLPSMYLVYEWITAVHHAPLSDFKAAPEGNWILCGFGRFGRAVQERMAAEGVETVVIEAEPERTGAPPGTIAGRGTEARTLLEAGIDQAAGIIAGTDNDTNNLSIVVTARDLKPDLFAVVRQNQQRMNPVFEAAGLDLVMQPATLVARYILGLIVAPLLEDFLRLARQQDESWANLLVSRVAGVVEDLSPQTWDVEISPESAPAVHDALSRGREVLLEHICTRASNRDERLPLVPLLIKRDRGDLLLPEMEEPLREGDQILLCGHERTTRLVQHTLYDAATLEYIQTGIDRPTGTIWRWLTHA